jgi:hypothetical protein
VQALPGNPYDGHTLAHVIPAMQELIGNTLERVMTDAGYRRVPASMTRCYSEREDSERASRFQDRSISGITRARRSNLVRGVFRFTGGR